MPAQHDPKVVWVSIHQLLSGAATALQPLTMDVIACRVRVKLCCDTSRDVPANVQPELLLALILFPQTVDARQAREVKPQAFKSSQAMALAKLSTATQPSSSQAPPSKGKTKPSASMPKSFSGQLWPFQVLHTQKNEPSSSLKLFSHHSSHKGSKEH